MALGSPAIPTPNQIELRAIQTAISNARQRIEALEGATNTNAATASASSTAASTQTNALRILLDALAARVTLLESEIVGPDDGAAQIATRSFMPHVPVTQSRPVDDSAALLAARAFMPRAPAPPTAAGDEPELLANRVFMPHVPLTQSRGVNDSAGLLAARAFMPHVPLTQAPVIPTVPTFDDVGAMLAARAFMPHVLPAQPLTPQDGGDVQGSVRAFMPHVPLTQSPLPQEAATLLATSIFGT